ncbi:3-phosphoserine/phosphohydroxythreonine transaminase [Evansella sp. AB-P1]|uniref:3-phosphoserine/phosphohydroxythreonine transaminase n=1 Tax=Evansella sp. AB-P1 TaxID=3037653 RepID=UPI00241CD3D8|nr:3-phosphoserine/phosphohydroxythreonine transaminase [Evansella sp. AB-P1]MDG5786409.1 3-phosphoserine/phosphohydroxythreonine transaminase [Evansella sp. AB-P1]
MKTVYNFNPGPSALPKEVLQEAKESMFDYKDSSLSVIEMSHRGPLYEEIHFQAINRVRALLDVPEEFDILFIQGGASLQFAMLPMNFLTPEKKGAYVLSGSWSEKAYQEAERIGNAYTLASSKENQFRSIPSVDYNQCSDDTSYIHITSNNTIFGTQWAEFPKKTNIPVFVDASSDIFSYKFDWNNVDVVYAGAQKNAGPSGVTVVIMRKSLMQEGNKSIPKILSYETHAKSDSLYHTPPTGSIYLLGLVMKWIEENGGVDGMKEKATNKAALLYDVIDNSNNFYVGHAEKNSRSLMNVTFRIADEALEKKFIKEAAEKGFEGIKGHRSVGGCRASIYNAVPVEHVEALAQFMKEFQQNN